MKLYRYTVSGSGYFPVDMLRYDSAWPNGQQSATDMLSQHRGSEVPLRRVELMSIKTPTAARWRSFGWRVDQPIATVLS
jgi:hypothetical protein